MKPLIFVLFFLLFSNCAFPQLTVIPEFDGSVKIAHDSVSLIVSQTGYAYPGVCYALLCSRDKFSGEKINLFVVEDTLGKVLYKGKPRYWGEWAECFYWYIDLSFLKHGKYRVTAGSLKSHLFSVHNVPEHYINTLSEDMFTTQLHKRRKNDEKGGFVDCGNDIRETGSHATMALGICKVLHSGKKRFSEDEQLELLNQLQHFGDFFIKQCDSSGKMNGGHWQEWALNRLGVVPGQMMAIQALLEISTLFKLYSETTSAKYYKVAELSLRNIRSRFRTDTLHSALLCLWLQAEVVFNRIAADSISWKKIAEITEELSKRQISKENKTQFNIYGTFYEYRGSNSILRLNYHGKGYDFYSLYWGNHIQGFLDLILLYPENESVGTWRKIVKNYYDGYILSVTKRNPFGLIANGEYYGIQWFSDLFHGINVTYAKAAEQMVKYGMAMGDTAAYSLAEKQLLWVAGLNTGIGYPEVSHSVSCIVGKGYQWIRDGYGEFPDIPGSIVNGFSATEQFKQKFPENGDVPRYLGNESYIAHTGAWLSAIILLTEVRPLIYADIDNGEGNENINVVVSPNPSNGTLTIVSNRMWQSFTMYDVLGKEILFRPDSIVPNKPYVFDTLLLNTPPLSDGLYFICFHNNRNAHCVPITIVK